MCEVTENNRGFMVVNELGEPKAIFFNNKNAEYFMEEKDGNFHIEQVDFYYELIPKELLK